jgi:hypothetical protein
MRCAVAKCKSCGEISGVMQLSSGRIVDWPKPGSEWDGVCPKCEATNHFSSSDLQVYEGDVEFDSAPDWRIKT